jgi:hypothetical protein
MSGEMARTVGAVDTVELNRSYKVATTLIFKNHVDVPRAWQSFSPLSSPDNPKAGTILDH